MKSHLGITVIVFVLVACNVDTVMGPTTVATSVTHSESTTTVDAESTPATTPTTDPSEPSTSTIDLLDGSTLEVSAPRQLQLAGYAFTMEVPGIRSSTVDLARGVDPSDAASVDEAAELESDLGNGTRLWHADREGHPFYMTVDLGGWGAFFHVGNETAPDTELLSSIADRFRGETSENGVVLTDYQPEFFTTYLSEPTTENLIHLGANQCIQETGPDTDIVQDAGRGEAIRGPEYASWCDDAADIEVMVFGDDEFVQQVLDGMTLFRHQPHDP